MAVNVLTRAKTKAFQLWIKSIIGEEPAAIEYADHIEIDFTPAQVQKFKDYLHGQVRGSFVPTDKPPPDVQIRFGKVLIPWSIETLAPLLAGSYGLGWLSKALLSKK